VPNTDDGDGCPSRFHDHGTARDQSYGERIGFAARPGATAKAWERAVDVGE
jgi:hypothetical protein